MSTRRGRYKGQVRNMTQDWRKSTEEFRAAMATANSAEPAEERPKRRSRASREDQAAERQTSANDAHRDEVLVGRDYVAAYSRKYAPSSRTAVPAEPDA
jgi:hypothetical protein